MPSICLVERDPSIVRIYQELLGDSFNYQHCSSLQSFGQALEQANRFSLVVTDVYFDDGRIDQVSPIISDMLKTTPVLIVTSESNFEICKTALNNWADDLLSKPFSNELFLLKCHYLLSRKSFFHCDPVQMTIQKNGALSDPLTANEYRLLTLLDSIPQHEILWADASSQIWGGKVPKQRVHTLLSRLRPKIQSLNLNVEFSKEGKITISEKLEIKL